MKRIRKNVITFLLSLSMFLVSISAVDAHADANKVSKPKISSVVNVDNSDSSGLIVKWGKISGASGYEIYRSKDGNSFSKVKTISKNSTVSWIDAKATANGSKYQYKILAFKKNGKKTVSSGKSAVKECIRLSQPSISSLKSSKTKELTVKWNKNSKASGYEIKYVIGDKEKITNISKNSTVSKTLTSLKSGKEYKVYIRSYKKISDKTYYSSWSKAKNCKVKKESNKNNQDKKGARVYISETGTKYHSINNCGRMNPNRATVLSESDAINRGYSKCSKCW